MAGWRYRFFHLDQHFPQKDLLVIWIPTATKKAASLEECKLLYAYLEDHCELPPLNYKFNYADWELRSFLQFPGGV
jgi:hypothetical protein